MIYCENLFLRKFCSVNKRIQDLLFWRTMGVQINSDNWLNRLNWLVKPRQSQWILLTTKPNRIIAVVYINSGISKSCSSVFVFSDVCWSYCLNVPIKADLFLKSGLGSFEFVWFDQFSPMGNQCWVIKCSTG